LNKRPKERRIELMVAMEKYIPSIASKVTKFIIITPPKRMAFLKTLILCQLNLHQLLEIIVHALCYEHFNS